MDDNFTIKLLLVYTNMRESSRISLSVFFSQWHCTHVKSIQVSRESGSAQCYTKTVKMMLALALAMSNLGVKYTTMGLAMFSSCRITQFGPEMGWH